MSFQIAQGFSRSFSKASSALRKPTRRKLSRSVAAAAAAVEILESRTLLAAATFDFTVPQTQMTSAGVFKDDGTLMRTLWSGVSYDAGTYTKAWDGLDDFGNRVADGAYQVRVLTNNVTYTWEGVVGNTSTSKTDSTVWKSYDNIGALAISGGTAYYGNGYPEAGGTSGRFSLSAPNASKTLIGGKGGDTWFVTTDGTNVYFAGQDNRANETETATSVAAGSFTCTKKNWTVNQWVGFVATIKFAGVATKVTITSNTAQTVNFVGGTPDANTTFSIDTHTSYVYATSVATQTKASTSIVGTAGTVTVTSAAHGYPTGTVISVQGAVPSGFNGTYTITSTGADTFTYANATTGSATTQAQLLRDDVPVIFANGAPYTPTYGVALGSVIDKRTDGVAISGLAVQPTGNYLFVSHSASNILDVVNKTTGQVVQSITTLTAPGAMVVDGNNNLWIEMLSGSTPQIRKYTVNADGTLGSYNVVSATFSSPLAMAVSPDNTRILVVDGGTSQQIKAFKVSDRTVDTAFGTNGVFGQIGGYTTGPNVTNDKFMFEVGTAQGNRAFAGIAFQPDGSFWVTDMGNDRVQHYAANTTYIDRIQYLSASYNASIDQNDPTRLFSDYLEFDIDYSKSLDPTNGSWVLARNWAGVLPTGYAGDSYRKFFPQTLQDDQGVSRVYALLMRNADGKMGMFELTSAGAMRDVGAIAILGTTGNVSLQPDGSLRTVSTPSNGIITWTISDIQSWSNGNPSYAAARVLATAPASETDPVWRYDVNHIRPGVETSGDILVSFDHQFAGSLHSGYHLGGVREDGTGWLWRTSMATHTSYLGDYPMDGSFDVGNDIWNGGSLATTLEHNIFWGYYGEHYKASQTNMFAHYNDDGLFVSNFGVVGADVSSVPPAAGMAGNALNPWVIRAPDGNVYLYHNDESWHSGLHRWRIDGLTSIAEQTANITYTSEATSGLRGQYFDTSDLYQLNSKTIRSDGTVNFNWGTGIPTGIALTAPDNYSVRWEGYVNTPSTQLYSFFADIDAGASAKLWVNGKLIADVNVATGGTASASSSITDNESSKAFDGSTSTKWVTAASTGWLRYQFGASESKVLSRYTITSASDLPARDPKSWQFQGSNDGTAWTTMDTQTNQAFSGRLVTNAYTVRNDVAYKYYRLNITANNGDTSTQIAEMTIEQRAVALTGGTPYNVRMEYSHGTGTASAILSWAWAGQAKQVVPQAQLSYLAWQYPGATSTVNLLEGLKFDTPVENNMYGWTRNGATNASDWTVRTSKYSYSKTAPDISMSYKIATNGASSSVTRNLGIPSDATTAWALSGHLNYSGNYANHTDTSGQYLEVLDDAGKVIARFYPRMVVYKTDYRIYANTQTLVSLPEASFNAMMQESQPFQISASGGVITFNYAGYQTTASVFDPTSNWRRATNLHWRAFTSTQAYTRAIGFSDLTFEAVLPAAPSALSATTVSQTQIDLGWTDNSNNETGFEIDRATNSTFTAGLTTFTVGAGVTTFNSTGLTANTTYYYRVRSTNAAGDSADSATASATTLAATPAAPSGLTATAVSSAQIDLAWSDNSNNETGFEIDRATDSAFTAGLTTFTVGAGVTTYNSTGLTASTTYYYRVRATNAAGDSANSATASATTTSLINIFRAHFNGTGTGTGGASDLVDFGGTGALVAGGTGNTQSIQSSPAMDGNFIRNDVTTASATARVTLTPTSAANSWAAMSTKPGSQWLLNGGFDYFWRANGTSVSNRTLDFSNSGSGGWRVTFFTSSDAMRMELLGPVGTPTASKWTTQVATTFSANQIYHVGVTMNTDPATGLVTVRYFRKAGTDAIDTTSTTDRVLEGTFQPDEAYITSAFSSGAFQFGTLETAGYAKQNDMDSFRLWNADPDSFPAIDGGEGLPTAPSGLNATAVSSAQIDLAWSDNSNNETGFEIDRATNSTFTAGLTTFTVGAGVTTYNSTGLTASTTYYYRVRATNAAGDSANSATASATTTSLINILRAYFNGTGTGTGGASDLVDFGGTGALVAGGTGNTQSIQSSPTMDGNFMRNDVTTTAATARVTLTPTSAANSWAAMSTKPGSQWLLNGGFDYFWRANGTSVNNRTLDFSNSGSGGWRVTFYTAATSMRMELLGPTGTPTAGTWTTQAATTFSANQIYHVGVTMNTDPATGLVTVRYFRKAGTDAIDTTSTTDRIVEGTFQPDEAYITSAFSSGAFQFGTLETAGYAKQNDMDSFRLWNADPDSFPAIDGGEGLMMMQQESLLMEESEATTSLASPEPDAWDTPTSTETGLFSDPVLLSGTFSDVSLAGSTSTLLGADPDSVLESSGDQVWQ